jgi:chromosome segregation ATPase
MIATENLTSFGLIAVKLDGDFSELHRISGQLQRLSLDSDRDLDRAMKLLTQFTQHGQSISDNIQEFSKTLQLARENSERAAQVVAQHAQIIQSRQQLQSETRTKIGELGLKVNEAIQALMTATENCASASSQQKLKQLDLRISGFIEEAQSIQTQAEQACFKTLAREVKSLNGTLLAAREKLRNALPAS